MFSVTSLGFLPFMALFACLWYRVPQPSRWKLVWQPTQCSAFPLISARFLR